MMLTNDNFIILYLYRNKNISKIKTCIKYTTCLPATLDTKTK
jgi:hypothetical protein